MEGTQKKMDMRVVKTRRAIRQALIELLSGDGGEDITAREVAERALISKKTFCAHYAGVWAAIDEMEDEAVAGVEKILGADGGVRSEAELAEAIARLGAMAQDKATMLGALLQTRVRGDVVARLESVLRDRIAAVLAPAGEDGTELLADFLAGGVVSAFRQWLDSGRRETPEDLSQRIAKIFSAIGRALPDERMRTAGSSYSG